MKTTHNDYSQRDCKFCGYQNCPIILYRKNFKIRKCPHCSVLWCDPLHINGTIHKSYENTYLKLRKSVEKENRKRLSLMEKYVSPFTHKNLLEVGCMHGRFLKMSENKGYNVQGVDISKTAVQVSNTIIPNKVKFGTLDNSFSENSKDIVASFNVIEHMDSPELFIDHVYRILKPHGVFILETPSKESIYHYVMLLINRILKKLEYEVGMHPDSHIFKFGNYAWKTILKDRSFEILETKQKSSPLQELICKKRKSSTVVKLGIVLFGILGRLVFLNNRILAIAKVMK